MSAPQELLGLVNHEAEITALAAMRHDTKAAIALAEQLEPSDFYDPRRQVVFEAIVNLLRGIEPIDTNAIVAECRQVAITRKLKAQITKEYIESLTGDLGLAVAYGHTVKRLAWLRQAGDFAFWLTKELQQQPDPAELFIAAQERWQHLQPKRENSRFVYGWDTIARHQERMRQRAKERAEGIVCRYDWPWASWNAQGRIRPLQRGMVGILAAPDGMGKTTYLEMIAEHWAKQGFHTIYVHLEDNEEYKMDRRLSRHAQVPLDRIQDSILSPEEEERLRDAQDRISDWAGFLHYYDAAGQSMTAIVRELESRVAEGVCQAVVFDYLDKVAATSAQARLYGDHTYERQANDMEQLKSFAEKSKVVVFTATQGNKAMQGEGIKTRKNIQGSGQKSQKAQLVVILTRDLVGENGLRDANGRVLAEPGEYSPIVRVRIDKQNQGKTCEFQQFLVGQYFTVRDIANSSGK